MTRPWLVRLDDARVESHVCGYNTASDRYGANCCRGRDGSVIVVGAALQNAARVASLMLAADCLVAERARGEKPGGAGGHACFRCTR
jgi:hypothetical protein